MKDSDKNKRISLIIKEKHISATKFAKEISFNQSNLSKILRCERKVPDELEIKILQRYQDINKVWLLTGEGSMLKETSKDDNNASFVAPYIKDELIYLPLFSVPALASFMENTSQATGTIETYPVYVAKGEAYTKDKHIVIEVKGESMYPTINNKAMILCEKVEPEQWDNVQSEQIIAIVYDNSFTIKRVLRNNLATTNTLTLSADNPKYGTLEVARCDIKGIYKAIKKVSEYL